MVLVDDRQGDVLDVGGHGEAEKDQLEDGGHENRDEHALVAEGLDDLLAQDGQHGPQHGYSSLSFIFRAQKSTMTRAKRASGPP